MKIRVFEKSQKSEIEYESRAEEKFTSGSLTAAAEFQDSAGNKIIYQNTSDQQRQKSYIPPSVEKQTCRRQPNI